MTDTIEHTAAECGLPPMPIPRNDPVYDKFVPPDGLVTAQVCDTAYRCELCGVSYSGFGCLRLIGEHLRKAHDKPDNGKIVWTNFLGVRDLKQQLTACREERDGLREVCHVCECSITEFVEAEQPTSTDWVNLRAARHLARAALTPKPEHSDGAAAGEAKA